VPSSEKIISPGVFTNEIDQTFLPAAVADIGAALIGPTVKGPAGIPTVVQSYSEYQTMFGDTFKSGSSYYQYLTSHTAKEYLKYGASLTVVRILDGVYSGASANVLTGSGNYYTGSATAGDTEAAANTSFKLHTLADGAIMNSKDATSGDETAATATLTFHAGDVAEIGDTLTLVSSDGTSVTYTWVSSGNESAADAKVHASNTATTQVDSLNNAIVHANNHGGKISVSQDGTGLIMTLTQVSMDNPGNTTIVTTGATSGQITITSHFTGGVTDPVGSNNLLLSGSKDNLRWEISTTNPKKGSFTLLIRRGDDNYKRKQTLESWNNLTLDENASNYIGKVIGDQVWTLRGSGGTDPYLQLSGSYPNKSKYVRVSAVKNTTDYLDENGNVRVPAASASMPGLGSGSYGGSFSGGSDGTVQHPKNFYDNITDANSQGLILTSATEYEDAINILGNQDEYDINLVLMPGVTDAGGSGGGALITKAIDMCEKRGDCFVIADPTLYESTIVAATNEADARHSSYAAMYYPWVQIPDPATFKNVWVPPSVVMGGVYAFNDSVAHPWFAPAGLNRGVIPTAIQAERKLTHTNRDTLYDSNVNPISTFPGQGVTVWGQKTLQKKASALDRVNVRRLLIKVKKFIASSSKFLVFEQNNAKTRSRFLSIVNPYLEQVQSNSGLNAFRVVMDETNNTPDLVDRNILYGQIFLQPTRTAEFIVLDFTVQPTGATFPE
jgi:hypothetical protein